MALGSGSARDEALRALLDLHDAVDAARTSLAAFHAGRLRCRRGCSDCCVDEITVFEVEAERIVRRAAEVLREAPHPEGACAFLDPAGCCRIYADRPYVCRTQGLPLRWFDRQEPDGDLVEMRDICPLNDPGGIPVEALPEDACFTIGPFESSLAGLQRAWGRGRMARIGLRDLFRR